MSRVAKQPIVLPKGVDISRSGSRLSVKGAKGTLEFDVAPGIDVVQEGNELKVSTSSTDPKVRAMSGTTRALLVNVVNGVAVGFEKKLELVGVGYRAQAKGRTLSLSLGFSHPVEYPLPEGVTAETPTQTEILVKGFDKQRVAQVASEIRRVRPPEPYKGKGVKYSGEQIARKEAKKK